MEEKKTNRAFWPVTCTRISDVLGLRAAIVPAKGGNIRELRQKENLECQLPEVQRVFFSSSSTRISTSRPRIISSGRKATVDTPHAPLKLADSGVVSKVCDPEADEREAPAAAPWGVAEQSTVSEEQRVSKCKLKS